MRSFESLNSDNSEALSGLGTLKLPDISDRSFWESLPADYREERLKLAEDAAAKDWPEILMSDYLRFSHDGNRTYFEDRFFTRRRMLTSLVMGECIEAKGRFLRKIIDGIYLILGETTWCLPAHNSYIRDTRQFTIPDTSRPVLDLFSGETAAILSVAEALLRPVLFDESPFISTAIDNALHERVIAPYLRFHFWWMGNGLEPMCNWTPWITQNVLLTAFTRPVDTDSVRATMKAVTSHADDETTFSNRRMSSVEIAERLRDRNGRVEPPDWRTEHWHPCDDELSKIYRSAVKSVHHFLSEYEEDGCCDEGAQYYSHAGLCLFGCLSILNDISHDTEKPWSGSIKEFAADETKIRNIANFISKVHVGEDYYINFADCSPHAGRRGAREYLFGALTHDDALMNFAAEDYRSESWTERLNPSEENLWYHLLNARCHERMMNQASDISALVTPDAWFPSTGLMVTRDTHYVLAAKAGDNADSHNHNDVGSFILYKDNRPFIIDLGVGSYTQKTFSKDRYDIWTMQSRYHNLPSFYDTDGRLLMEHDGEEYRATEVSCRMDETHSILSMELQNAYPGLDGKLQRSVIFNKDSVLGDSTVDDGSCEEISYEEKVVIIKDHYDGKLKFEENIITYEKPVLEDICDETSLSERSGTDISRTKASRQAADGIHDEIHRNQYIIKVGNTGKLHAFGFSEITVEELPITDPRLGETWKHSCYRIKLQASEEDVSLIFS
ncbi:Heparinase II/III-like protein [Lachnospiraceae bacterium JC7]|nr:Heparinase II/III-like protein [Lachnospiraceae bacterium JC7]